MIHLTSRINTEANFYATILNVLRRLLKGKFTVLTDFIVRLEKLVLESFMLGFILGIAWRVQELIPTLPKTTRPVLL